MWLPYQKAQNIEHFHHHIVLLESTVFKVFLGSPTKRKGKSLTLNCGKIWRTGGIETHSTYTRISDKKRKHRKNKQNFQVSESRYLHKAWRKLNLQSSKLAEARAQGKIPQYGYLIPLQKITKHSNTRGPVLYGTEDWECADGVKMQFL